MRNDHIQTFARGWMIKIGLRAGPPSALKRRHNGSVKKEKAARGAFQVGFLFGSAVIR
jgi:hypothetical protein